MYKKDFGGNRVPYFEKNHIKDIKFDESSESRNNMSFDRINQRELIKMKMLKQTDHIK